MRKALLSCLIFIFSSAANAAEEKATLKQLEENLQRIDSAIAVTKQRIESQRETQFAPDLYFVLAEQMQDKAVSSSLLKKERQPGVAEGELDFNAEKRMRQEAVEMLKLIEDRYADYASLDRVLYTLANEYKILGNDKEALAYYKKISERFPKSSYASKALLEIGDVFFGRRDYEFAVQQYRKALLTSKEPELSKAQFKIGNCLVQLGKWHEAFGSYGTVFRRDETAVESELHEEALVASVWPLLELSPEQVLRHPELRNPMDYYRKYAGDKANYRRVLARLAQRLALKKRDVEAVAVNLELFRLSVTVSEKREAFENAYTTIKKQKSVEFPVWMAGELRELLHWMMRPPVDAKTATDIVRYEPVFRDVLTTLTKAALATSRAEDLMAAANGYDDYFAIYPRTKFTAVMKLNLAETLFNGGETIRAGQTYYELTRFKIGDQKRLAGFYTSALEAFLKTIGDSKASAIDKLQARDGYREVGALFSKRMPNDPKIADIQFNIARTYYDEQNFDTAAKYLFDFLSKRPGHAQAKAAALLYLDCFYLRGQMKEMAQAGGRVLKIAGLSQDARSAIGSAARQAQMKALRSVAGDFGSKDYATKFREFARANKNSNMGEQALYEAFVSLKAQSQPQAFEIGEEYVGSYEKSPRAKEVLISLSQLALVILDHARAASYMATFAQKYPQDPNAKAFSTQAALIYDYTGDLSKAAVAYQLSGDTTSILKSYFRSQQWNELNRLASKYPGVRGQYYQGISLVRLNNPAGYGLLERVARGSANDNEEKEMIGHAGVVVGEKMLAQFRATAMNQAFSAGLIQQKSADYQNISSYLQASVNSGAGTWTVGGLYNLAVLNRLFVSFLKTAKPPAGMDPAQLQQAMAGQIQTYEKTAGETLAQCKKVAEENQLFTGYVKGCRDNILITEASEFQQRRSVSRMPASESPALQAELKANPRSATVLQKIAEQDIKGGQSLRALLVLSRAGELAPNDALNESYTGIAYMNLNMYVEAQAAFKNALQKNPDDALANRGLAGLSKAFGYMDQFKRYQAKAGRNQAASSLHPWLAL